MFGWLVEVSSVRTFARVRENSGKTGKKNKGPPRIRTQLRVGPSWQGSQPSPLKKAGLQQRTDVLLHLRWASDG